MFRRILTLPIEPGRRITPNHDLSAQYDALFLFFPVRRVKSYQTSSRRNDKTNLYAPDPIALTFRNIPFHSDMTDRIPIIQSNTIIYNCISSYDKSKRLKMNQYGILSFHNRIDETNRIYCKTYRHAITILTETTNQH